MATRNPGSTHQLRLVEVDSEQFFQLRLVEVDSVSHYLQGFDTSKPVVGLGISKPSTVSQGTTG